MGAFSRFLGFFGFGAQVEIAQKTFGQTFRVKDRRRLLEEAKKMFWACGVLGDRFLPRLQDRRIGRVGLGGGVVLAIASIVPMLLLLRFGYRLYNHASARPKMPVTAHVQTTPTKGEQHGDN